MYNYYKLCVMCICSYITTGSYCIVKPMNIYLFVWIVQNSYVATYIAISL